MIAALAAAIIPLMFQNVPLWRPGLSEAAIKRVAFLLLGASFAVLIADVCFGASLGTLWGGTQRRRRAGAVELSHRDHHRRDPAVSIRAFRIAPGMDVGNRRVAVRALLLTGRQRQDDRPAAVLAALVPVLALFSQFDPRLATVLCLRRPDDRRSCSRSSSSSRTRTPSCSQRHQFAFHRDPFPSARSLCRLLRAHRELTRFCQISVVHHLIACPYWRTRPDARRHLSRWQLQRAPFSPPRDRIGRSSAHPGLGARVRRDPVAGIDGLAPFVATLHRGFVRHRRSGGHERAVDDRPAVEQHRAAVPAVVADRATRGNARSSHRSAPVNAVGVAA